jgi:hypothetical protein
MARYHSSTATKGCGGCFGILLTWAILGLVSGLLTQYVVDFWAPHIVHHAVSLPFLPAMLLGFVTGPTMLTLAIVTWCCSFLM